MLAVHFLVTCIAWSVEVGFKSADGWDMIHAVTSDNIFVFRNAQNGTIVSFPTSQCILTITGGPDTAKPSPSPTPQPNEKAPKVDRSI